jgi:Zn-dependent M32 family carboxypeptidase
MTDLTASVSQNYSEEMINQMTAAYEAAPTRETVDALSESLKKPVRSVISKLSALGIYQRQERVAKTGKPIVKKEVFVAEVQERLGAEFPSMEKMTKADLERLVSVLSS